MIPAVYNQIEHQISRPGFSQGPARLSDRAPFAMRRGSLGPRVRHLSARPFPNFRGPHDHE